MFKNSSRIVALIAWAFCQILGSSIAFAEQPEIIKHRIRLDNANSPEHYAKASAGATSNGISYRGGPLILGTTKMYYIWYGNWSSNTATTILPFLAQNIGGSARYNINTTYYNGSKVSVSNSVAFGGSITDNYSRGSALTDSDVATIVTNAINGTDPSHQSGTLPYDTNGIYFVLTSADVSETSGFCTKYCGWHTYKTLSGGAIKYSFVGNPDRCPSACSAQTISPNGNLGADAMASIIVHELEEAVTDPQLNAWYDNRGYENADKCAWTFGTVSTASNGSKYNTVLNGMKFLIQRNWVNASGGYCSVSF
jgi:hypothetical protein